MPTEHRKLPKRWTITVCPACNGIAQRLREEHTGDCPNRSKTFALQTVFVVPEPRPTITRPDDPDFSIYDEARFLREALQEIAKVSIPEVNPDGDDQAADTMRSWAVATLEQVGFDVPEQRKSVGLPPEAQTTEQLAVEHLHEWLAQRGESYRYAVVRPQAHEPASVADLEVLLVGDEDYENATDADPILGNALLGALGKVLAQREAAGAYDPATTDAQEGR